MLILLVVVGHWGWGKRAQSQMEAELARYRAAGVKIDPWDFRETAPPPDDQNAAIDLIAAGELLNTNSGIGGKFRCINNSKPFDEIDLAIIAKKLHHSRDALRRLDLAMTKPLVHWKHTEQDLEFYNSSNWWTVTQNLPDLLRSAALRAHCVGDDRESLLRIRQLLFIARAVDQDATLVAHHATMGLRSDVCELILRIAPDIRTGRDSAADISASQLREVINELMDEQTPRQALVKALEVSRMRCRLRVEAYVQGKIDLNFQSRSNEEYLVQARRYFLKPIAFEDLPIMFDHASRMIDAASHASHWPGLKASMPDISRPNEVSESVLLHLVAFCFTEPYQTRVHRHFQVLTEQHLAATALAIRCYAGDHAGQMPSDLDDLIPTYLPTLPSDPMSYGGRRLAYRANPADPILYSVGDDGNDDGGSTESVRGRHKYDGGASFDWQTRDVVVHLNPQPRVNDDDNAD